jgi:hypothetical protein
VGVVLAAGTGDNVGVAVTVDIMVGKAVGADVGAAVGTAVLTGDGGSAGVGVTGELQPINASKTSNEPIQKNRRDMIASSSKNHAGGRAS